MATDSAKQAIANLRSSAHFQWYVVTLLVLVMYLYAHEIKKARQTGNWNVVFAGLAFFGMDMFNEIWNALIFHFNDYAAFWMTPKDSAYIILIGWNIEIAFMFAISGIVFANTLLDDKKAKLGIGPLKLNNRWALSIGFSAFAVIVELLLHAANELIWSYPFWDATFAGVWLIFLIGYLHFFIVSFWVHDMEKVRSKAITVGIIYTIDIAALILFIGFLHWI